MPAAEVERWTSITIHDPAPRLNANRTSSRFASRGDVREWRKAGWVAGVANKPKIPAGSIATVTVELGSNRPNQRRDPANFYPVTKALVDGLTDAGLWPDDDAKHVRTTEPMFTTDIPHRHFRIHVEWRPQ